MNSNNLDQKPLLAYVASTIKNWGIEYLTQDALRKAKKNDASILSTMKQLLLDLCLLHMLNYDYLLSQLQITGLQEYSKEILILSHLSEIECPMLVGEGQVGLRFQSSRQMLLIVSWLMAVSDFFSQTENKLLMHKMKLLYSSQSQQEKCHKSKRLSQTQPFKKALNKNEKIAIAMKLMKNKKNYVESLYQKKWKLLKNLQKGLRQSGSHIDIDSILCKKSFNRKIQNQINQILQMEIKNMKYRQYFWVWLDQKIIKYYKACNVFEEQLRILQEQIQQLGLQQPKGKFKELEIQVKHDVRQAIESPMIHKKIQPSFVGAQLRKQMNLIPKNKIKPTDGNSQSCKQVKAISGELQRYLLSIQQIKII